METTKRNWSAVADCKGQERLRSFLTREEWIRQCLEWYDEKGYEDGRAKYEDELNEMEDWELMDDIQDTWGVLIIETTWLKVGNECAWHRDGGDWVVRIIGVPRRVDGWSSIHVDYNGRLYSLPLHTLYGLTGETCPHCGAPLYVSDLCRFDYVCLTCDQNFC